MDLKEKAIELALKFAIGDFEKLQKEGYLPSQILEMLAEGDEKVVIWHALEHLSFEDLADAVDAQADAILEALQEISQK